MAIINADKINISGTLVRNTGGVDKIVDGKEVEGGYFVCGTLPSIGDHWTTGQLCYCTGDSKFYQYNGSKWDIAKLGGGSDAVELETEVLSVVNNNPTLSWGTTSTIGSIDGTELTVTMPNKPDTDTDTWRKVQLNGTDKLGTGTNTNPLNIKAGSNMTITESNGTFTFAAPDNTWRPIGTGATDAAAGNHNHDSVYAAKSHGTHVAYGGNGSATTVSRSDHTHAYKPTFSKTIYHGAAGNPQQIKFITVDYSTYDSGSAAYFKLDATSCHGNGVSYQFLEEILIGVTASGDVSLAINKSCQQSTGAAIDGTTRYYGDVFAVKDTTNKKVDFYILGGQWCNSSYSNLTPIGSATTTGVTQHTSFISYSSGVRQWAQGCGNTCHDYLPLSGGTVTGSLTVNEKLYGPQMGSNPRNQYDSGLYFFNCDPNSTSSYNFGLYQWVDKFQFTTRTASNNAYKTTAFEIDGNTGTTSFSVTPTVNGTAVSLNGHTHDYAASSHTHTSFSSGITVSGEVQATAFKAASDRRLKENIKEFIPQKSILDLPVVEFDFKETGTHHIGCIAQDLQEICPELVSERDDGYLKIEESKLVYLLIDEVKKLRKEVNELKGTN